MKPVNVHNEWDPVEDIVIGIIDGARLPKPDRSLHSIEFSNYQSIDSLPTGEFPLQVIEETTEDLDILAKTLSNLGVRIRRPLPTRTDLEFGTPNWRSNGLYNYCPRDVLLTVADQIIEAPCPVRARYFEAFAYREILLDCLKGGSRWFSAPCTELKDALYKDPNPDQVCLRELEPVFDAANILKIGRDILYLVSNTGNKMGGEWLQVLLGKEYRVHFCHDVYLHTHIDTTITLVRPGLVVLNPERVNANNLPPLFKNWDKIWCPKPIDIGYVGEKPYSTEWIAMNFLMVNPKLAIVDKNQTELIAQLNSHQVDVIPLQLRHARTLGGGFHCVTLELSRKGSLEDYS